MFSRKKIILINLGSFFGQKSLMSYPPSNLIYMGAFLEEMGRGVKIRWLKQPLTEIIKLSADSIFNLISKIGTVLKEKEKLDLTWYEILRFGLKLYKDIT